MTTFKDINGKNWEIRITLGSCKRIKDTIGFDMLHPEALQGEEGIGLLERLANDSFFDLKLIIALCSKSIQDNGYGDYTEEQLLDLFEGQTYQNACTAFYDEYQAFFQTIGKGQLALYVKKVLEILNYQLELVASRINAIDTKEIVDSVNQQSAET